MRKLTIRQKHNKSLAKKILNHTIKKAGKNPRHYAPKDLKETLQRIEVVLNMVDAYKRQKPNKR